MFDERCNKCPAERMYVRDRVALSRSPNGRDKCCDRHFNFAALALLAKANNMFVGRPERGVPFAKCRSSAIPLHSVADAKQKTDGQINQNYTTLNILILLPWQKTLFCFAHFERISFSNGWPVYGGRVRVGERRGSANGKYLLQQNKHWEQEESRDMTSHLA